MQDGIIKNYIIKKQKNFPLWDIAFLMDNEDFIIAGGAFVTTPPNDFDVYPVHYKKFDRAYIKNNVKSVKAKQCEVLYETQNALTIKVGKSIIQFCDYAPWSVNDDGLGKLVSLVDSFDFTHIQVGVLYHTTETDTGGYGTPEVHDVYFTDGFVESKLSGATYYVGSQYPLGSLIRLRKYEKRGLIPLKDYRTNILDILNSIVRRGYKSYEDFKDQLAAVDLQLLDGDESNSAYRLFQTLQDRGLVG